MSALIWTSQHRRIILYYAFLSSVHLIISWLGKSPLNIYSLSYINNKNPLYLG